MAGGSTDQADEVAGLLTAILADFGGRVLPIDLETVRHIAQLSEMTRQMTVALPDLIIAATTARHGLTVLTRNLSDLGRRGAPARDPLVDLPDDI